MNRTERKQVLQLRPFLDKLESRRLMSVEVPGARFVRELVHEKSELASQLAGGDLTDFAQGLAAHPRIAAGLGLGALSQSLRRHVGFAERHGWAASLVSELTAHPRYAAAHHLTAAMSEPQSPAAGPVSSSTQTTTTTASAGSTSTSGGGSTTPVIGPIGPSPVIQDPLSVAVGGTLDVTLPNLGLGTSNLTYTITPQPLPANMSFNRETGELAFAPMPGQAGVTNFSVAVSNGSRSGTIVLPVTVTSPAPPTTEVSGQVVDENGNPLAGMPVTIGTATAVTNSSGDFTLTGIPANPGPISAGGSVGTAQGRLDLTAPVAQLLGHDLYSDANNAIPSPLILPMIDWSTRRASAKRPPRRHSRSPTPQCPG